MCPYNEDTDKQLLQEHVELIACNPAGRIVLLRIFIEIQRPIKNERLGIEKTIHPDTLPKLSNMTHPLILPPPKKHLNLPPHQKTPTKAIPLVFQKTRPPKALRVAKINAPTIPWPYDIKLKNRSVWVHFTQDQTTTIQSSPGEGRPPIKSGGSHYSPGTNLIQIGLYISKNQCLQTANLQGQKKSLSVVMVERPPYFSTYHEICHWFKFLRHPERYSLDTTQNYSPSIFIGQFIDPSNLQELQWQAVLLFYFGDIWLKQKDLPIKELQKTTLLEYFQERTRGAFIPWVHKNQQQIFMLDIEEMRNILRMPPPDMFNKCVDDLQTKASGGLLSGECQLAPKHKNNDQFIRNLKHAYSQIYLNGDSDVGENYFRLFESIMRVGHTDDNCIISGFMIKK